MPLSRRRFLWSVAAAAAGLTLRPDHGDAAPPDALRVALILPAGAARGDGTAARAVLGARLGADEGAHAAALFGRAVQLTVYPGAPEALEERSDVLVGGFDDVQGERLSAATERGRAIFLNLAATRDALRAERCRPRAFHVGPSEAMLHAARAAADAEHGTVALWHESLRPFGAGQLNDRFRRRFGEGMDTDAWAAWMALKVAVEASLRTRSTVAADLAAYLVKPGVRFDGHKGRPLAFGPADHQLRQPLYLVGVDRSGAPGAQEIPVASSTRAAMPTPACGYAR